MRAPAAIWGATHLPRVRGSLTICACSARSRALPPAASLSPGTQPRPILFSLLPPDAYLRYRRAMLLCSSSAPVSLPGLVGSRALHNLLVLVACRAATYHPPGQAGGHSSPWNECHDSSIWSAILQFWFHSGGSWPAPPMPQLSMRRWPAHPTLNFCIKWV